MGASTSSIRSRRLIVARASASFAVALAVAAGGGGGGGGGTGAGGGGGGGAAGRIVLRTTSPAALAAGAVISPAPTTLATD